MSGTQAMEDRVRGTGGEDARARLLAGIPAVQRRLDVAGVSTVVLEGGDGPPMVLLHGPGGNATHWAGVVPALVGSCRVIIPDLPGQGATEPIDAAVLAPRMMEWLEALIATTCTAAPVLVGYAIGGGIAARFAIERGRLLRQLVLVDALGLVDFAPAPEFGGALHQFMADPTADTHEGLWRQCTRDLGAVQARMGGLWEAFAAYNLDRAHAPALRDSLGALMREFGMSAIPARDLARIEVPTTLVWGRDDLATPVQIARDASARHGWALRILEDCGGDPPMERPAALAEVLRDVLLGGRAGAPA